MNNTVENPVELIVHQHQLDEFMLKAFMAACEEPPLDEHVMVWVDSGGIHLVGDARTCRLLWEFINNHSKAVQS